MFSLSLRSARAVAAIALAALLASVSGCSLTQRPTEFPQVRVAAIQPESLGLGQQVFRVQLRLLNPNPQRIRVADGRLALDLEDLRVGTGELLDGLVLPAEGEGTASLRITTNLMDLAPQLLPRLFTRGSLFSYRLTGYMDLVGFGLGRIPVDESGRFSLAPPPGASPAQPL